MYEIKIARKNKMWGMYIAHKNEIIKSSCMYKTLVNMLIDCFFEEYIYQCVTIIRKRFIKIPYSRWG